MRQVVLVALVVLALFALPGAAQQRIIKHSVDNGGGRSSNAQFVLTGTVGQPDAVPQLNGGPYRLGGGFWTALPSDDIFSNGFEGD